jgi:hypothetical protein
MLNKMIAFADTIPEEDQELLSLPFNDFVNTVGKRYADGYYKDHAIDTEHYKHVLEKAFYDHDHDRMSKAFILLLLEYAQTEHTPLRNYLVVMIGHANRTDGERNTELRVFFKHFAINMWDHAKNKLSSPIFETWNKLSKRTDERLKKYEEYLRKRR